MSQYGKILAVAFSFLLVSVANAQLIRDEAVLRNMNASLEKQKLLASGRKQQLFDVLKRPMKPDERQALEYMYAYMPLSDLADYSGDYYYEMVRRTIQARNDMPWGYSIPEDVFLHFVLPIRVNNENLDDFRIAMYDEMKQRISGMNMHDAALEVNHWCHEKVTYRGSDERTSSPMASIRTSFGRCGEESTFTVSAMRAMGIPARQVYTPRWAHSDDNHAWVEVWVNGKWYFLGACEPDAELNMGWFAAPAMRAMLVHTRAYGWYNGNEPVIDSQEKFSELNLIGNYAETKVIAVKVLDEKGIPARDATVEYQLYNYAEFYPIAKGKTDDAGISTIRTGLGDLLIWATCDGLWNYKKITVEKTDTVTIRLTATHPANNSEIFDLVPPVEKQPPVTDLPEEAKQKNARLLQLEDSIRTAYMHTFRDSAWSAEYAQKQGLDAARTISLFHNSYGNWQEIKAFIESTSGVEREWAMNLLDAISEKDIRDTRSEILLDHLRNSLPYPELTSGPDAELFSNYVMSGRISNEMMLPWRGYIQQQFSQEFKNEVKNDVQVLVKWIKENIILNDTANLHSRSPLSPRGVYELKVADSRSRDVFFVAVCRCFGIPARVNPATYLPQYRNGNSWQNIAFEPVKENISEMGSVHFINGNPDLNPKYAINFTIARYRSGVYRSVELEYGKELTAFPAEIALEAGKYYLVTGNRQPDGTVLSSLTFFDVPAGKTTDVVVKVRESLSKAEPWAAVDLKLFPLENRETGERITASRAASDKGAIFIWIDPDKEPSKHVMADIPAVTSLLEKWNGGLVFLLQKERVTSSFKPANFSNLPDLRIYAYDTDNRFLKEISRLRKHNLAENLPVVVISDKNGKLFYFSEGYKIGIGEQLAKEVARMK